MGRYVEKGVWIRQPRYLLCILIFLGFVRIEAKGFDNMRKMKNFRSLFSTLAQMIKVEDMAKAEP
jgi:hypothetical protein